MPAKSLYEHDKSLDKNLIENTYIELRQRLTTYLKKRVSDREQIDDIVQDVFTKALINLDNEKKINNLVKWVYVVTKNALADHYRKTHSLSFVPIDNLDIAIQEEEQNFYLDLSKCLHLLTETLPEKYKETIIDADLNGKSLVSIANEKSLSVSAIKSRASRGRAMLKANFEKCCRTAFQAKNKDIQDIMCASENGSKTCDC